tara:strand:- start:789 stop:2213 length:1425 start_codon:yes stop_codon:yes gene_type:complete
MEHDYEIISTLDYLKNVRIIIDGEEHFINDIPYIINQLSIVLSDNDELNINVKTNIAKIVDDTINKEKNKFFKFKQSKWIDCVGNCIKNIKPFIDKEIISTVYFLRLLTNSIIDSTGNDDGKNGICPLKFKYINTNNEPLSGIWINEDGGGDHRFFKLDFLDNENKDSRLIMGLGPSASGKTFWAIRIIKLMQKTNGNFPRSFLSIDGGLMRELSFTYQYIINALSKDESIHGFDNLVSSGIDLFNISMFKSSNIKKKIKQYLILQTKNNNGICPVSLYVPETLGNPSPLYDGYEKGIKQYVDITQDNKWIGLYIWQGETLKDDSQWVEKIKSKNLDKLKDMNIGAKSTTVSGTSREKKEGKKFSSNAYKFSKKNGYKAIKKAPGGRIDIHNSGGKKTGNDFNKSVVIEYPNDENKYILNQDMLDEFNSIYLRKELDKIGVISGGVKFHKKYTKKHRRKYTKKHRRKYTKKNKK